MAALLFGYGGWSHLEEERENWNGGEGGKRDRKAPLTSGKREEGEKKINQVST